jgi:DNA-binding MarR family transcriptional regulator
VTTAATAATVPVATVPVATAPVSLRREVLERTSAQGAGLDTPAGRAWGTFLQAHASITRVLDTELRRDADLSLADFDVLMQLALGNGTLRMGELARATLLSRSGTTRRVERLERCGLVERTVADADRRSVRVSLTPAGVESFRAALDVHASGIATHFVAALDSDDAPVLRAVLQKVIVDCDFG